MLVDGQQFQTYSSLKNKQDVIPTLTSQDHLYRFVKIEPCFHYSYQATKYQICNHKECLQGAQDTCNWEFQRPK